VLSFSEQDAFTGNLKRVLSANSGNYGGLILFQPLLLFRVLLFSGFVPSLLNSLTSSVFYLWGWSGTQSTITAAIYCPIVTALEDRW
jgi:hypothetical protein